MKSEFFFRKDEVLLSMMTALVISGLLYQACFSLLHTKEHAIFQKNSAFNSKK